jgi:hypothetical protein
MPYKSKYASELYHLVVHCLHSTLKIPIKLCKLLLENPSKVMHDNLLLYLSKQDDWLMERVLKLYKVIEVGEEDPTPTFVGITGVLDECVELD